MHDDACTCVSTWTWRHERSRDCCVPCARCRNRGVERPSEPPIRAVRSSKHASGTWPTGNKGVDSRRTSWIRLQWLSHFAATTYSGPSAMKASMIFWSWRNSRKSGYGRSFSDPSAAWRIRPTPSRISTWRSNATGTSHSNGSPVVGAAWIGWSTAALEQH